MTKCTLMATKTSRELLLCKTIKELVICNHWWSCLQTCLERLSEPHIVPKNNQKIVLHRDEYWSGCKPTNGTGQVARIECLAGRSFRSARERWWFIALSRCTTNKTKQPVVRPVLYEQAAMSRRAITAPSLVISSKVDVVRLLNDAQLIVVFNTDLSVSHNSFTLLSYQAWVPFWCCHFLQQVVSLTICKNIFSQAHLTVFIFESL